jgi:hypothetical protein
MERKIIVFGNSDKSEKGFPTAADFDRYIREDVYLKEDGRYRFTQNKEADVIVLSRDGLLHGHFEIDDKVPPTDHDRSEYPPVKMVYLVRSSVLYDKPVPMSEHDISGIQFGRYITEEKFREVLNAARGSASFVPPTVEAERKKVLRLIEERRGQAAFRAALLEAFGGRCAVTGCDAVDALEAAHIDPYSVSHSHDPRNGLLLRSDIHTLFDLNLVGINPITLEVRLAPRLQGTSYADLQGSTICDPVSPTQRPDRKALERRWQQFSSGAGES